MNDDKFKTEVISKISNLERDLAYVKGKIEGRDYIKTQRKEDFSIIISSISLAAAMLLVAGKLLGW